MSEPIDVIVPVYNEEEGLETFYRRIKSVPLDLNLVFVDNASTDRSVEIIETFKDSTLVRHERNMGYGASLRDGIKGTDGSRIVIIDADCEYPPEAIPALVEGLKSADVVYASRFLENHEYPMPFLKILGNKIISGAYNLLFHQHVTDLYTGMKALRRSCLQGLEFKRDGYEYVLEMGVLLARKGIEIKEVFVEFEPRCTGRSKMKHVSETLKFLGLILYYRFSSSS